MLWGYASIANPGRHFRAQPNITVSLAAVSLSGTWFLIIHEQLQTEMHLRIIIIIFIIPFQNQQASAPHLVFSGLLLQTCFLLAQIKQKSFAI